MTVHIIQQKIGGAAWFIKTEDSTHLGKGSCIVPGPPDSKSSTRSELMDVLATMITISKIANNSGIENGKCVICCDGKSAIQAISTEYEVIHNNRKHFDLLQSIHSAQQHSQISFEFKHIKGHADDEFQFCDLNREQQLNVLANKEAKIAALSQLDIPNKEIIHNTILPFTRCAIQTCTSLNNTTTIHSLLQKSILKFSTTTTIRSYWSNKYQFGRYRHIVDWDLRKISNKNSTYSHNRWLSKFCTGFCGTGKMLELYKYQKHSKCPRCNTNNDNTAHVIQCPNEQACIEWDKSVDSLEQWMKKNKMSPNLIHIIISNINTWKYKSPQNQILATTPILQEVIMEQDRLGWKAFLDGFWSTKWNQAQKEYLHEINSPKSSELLLSKAQRRIWQIA